MMNKKYKKAVAGLGALVLVGGTLAYFSQSTTVENDFHTGYYEGTTVEKFNPTDGDDWQPGAEVDKEVGARNTGDSALWVRIKFDEVWENADKELASSLADKGFFPAVDKANQVDPEDGETEEDQGSVVYKNINVLTLEEAEAGNKDGWVDGGDGYFYWNRTLAPKGGATEKLLNSVTLCKDTDMGLYTSETYYKVTDTDSEPDFDESWTTTVPTEDEMKGKYVYSHTVTALDENLKGYAKDNYTLNITTEFVQAVKEAANGWAVIPSENN